MCSETEFNVEIDGIISRWEERYTGIRQGGPLSPYLFIIVMSVISQDVKKPIEGKLIEKNRRSELRRSYVRRRHHSTFNRHKNHERIFKKN